jgi:hypothetical protein
MPLRTTARLTRQHFAFLTTKLLGEVGDEVEVVMHFEGPSATLWRVASGKMKGEIIDGIMLSLDPPAS